MAKLPNDFVKAPAAAAAKDPAAAAPARKKRSRKKTGLVTAERARDLLREVVIRLGDDERRELELAREELARAGESVTIEQMVMRAIAEWCASRVAARAAAAAPPVESILERVRRLARDPLGTWRQLGARLRRLAPARL
ncbi:MAG TPA: hypothetical protein VKZ63_14090 [Kofleriaceae bacterium]|nr:hypothetical protein [Kofleriaceae bacterium]